MNCRPHDLARVISPGRLARCPSCGSQKVAVKPLTIVRVTEHDGTVWVLEEPLTGDLEFDCGTFLHWICRGLHDDLLRPIRDPGDDAVDEMVRIAGPAPITLTEILAGEETTS